jgi:hypothetical protein
MQLLEEGYSDKTSNWDWMNKDKKRMNSWENKHYIRAFHLEDTYHRIQLSMESQLLTRNSSRVGLHSSLVLKTKEGTTQIQVGHSNRLSISQRLRRRIRLNSKVSRLDLR